jgi:signal transduction histidine kinase
MPVRRKVRTTSTRSPTAGLMAGLVLTLAAVVADAWYTTSQMAGLRALQTDLAGSHRRASEQLLRIQNELNAVMVALGDGSAAAHPSAEWRAQFAHVNADLADALEKQEAAADTTARAQHIYTEVQRQAYRFVIATLAAIVATSLYVIRANRRLFKELRALSEKRHELAQQMISTRESTLREISRELHDEFGQILTAMGSMLARAGKHAPEGSVLRSELREVNELAQTTLNNVRGLSQSLHPSILEDAGLDETLDWYVPNAERQFGIRVAYERSGSSAPIDSASGIHIYRILQEALNNVARHSGASQARVRVRSSDDMLELEVEDHGRGLDAAKERRGLGIVTMRERAALVGGSIEFLKPEEGGTLVRLRVPAHA